jgi:hypothetical protein
LLPVVRGMDPRIQIRIRIHPNMLWIRNTDYNDPNTTYFYIVGDTELLREMILSILLHVQNIHVFPQNKKYKVKKYFPRILG